MGEARRRRAREAEQRRGRDAEREKPPEPYAHMSAWDYREMCAGEDPDDRAIREAHGIGYEEDYQDLSVMCRYGCGATYHEIAVGKRRKCEAAENAPRFAAGGIVATASPGSDEVPAVLTRGCVMPLPPLSRSLIDKLNARELEE